MSTQPCQPKPVAVLCGGLHITNRTPVQHLDRLKRACQGTPDGFVSAPAPLPVICAGGIFVDGVDLENGPPTGGIAHRTLAWVIRVLPRPFYAVLGVCDISGADSYQVDSSAYAVLAAAGAIIDLFAEDPVEVGGEFPLRLWGFGPWDKVTPPTAPHDLLLEVAVIHGALWSEAADGNPPAGAKSCTVKAWSPKLTGYDVAVFGGNSHKVHRRAGRCTVFNPGEPGGVYGLGLLYSDGTVEELP